MLLKSLIAMISVPGLLLAGCASAPATVSPVATATAPPRALEPEGLASPAASESTATETTTSTAEPFVLNFTPVPTETPLPTPELPTESVNAPASQVWDGLPTYPAESNPNYFFRLRYDPDAWALSSDAFGSPALLHRAVANCVISPTSGRGLPPDASTEHDMRRINGISYQISSTSVNGVRKFVTYAAGDGRVYTAFQVSLDERPDQCLLEAETVLSTLTSVPVSEATPIATP
jgi:hypothetical protein